MNYRLMKKPMKLEGNRFFSLKNWYKRSRLGLEDATAAGVGPRKEAKRRLFAQPSNWTLEVKHNCFPP